MAASRGEGCPQGSIAAPRGRSPAARRTASRSPAVRRQRWPRQIRPRAWLRVWPRQAGGPVSRHGSDVVGCAQPPERSARRIACPYRAVLASEATPRCASMASADRQMIRDATLVPADEASSAYRLPSPAACERHPRWILPMFKIPPVSAAPLPDLLCAMTKAELPIHIEGSLEPELIFALAQRNGLQLPYASVAELRSAYAFCNLQSFLDIYYAGASVLRHEQDFYDLAHAYLARAARDRVLHAEIFFDPQTHTARGVAIETVIDGLHRSCAEARTGLGISATLILCFLRHLSEKAAFET